MRVLTCFLPPSSGSASVAGFDVLEHPMEVKRRIGYLPETPPLYPEMEVTEYLTFVGRLKGISSADVGKRVDEVEGRCAVGDVRFIPKLIRCQLSKGYRQRVGLAQAIIHNPEVLILDEPTSGLDPKQIIETRELIHQLAGDHTIILSTHILSEIEHSCDKVIIISFTAQTGRDRHCSESSPTACAVPRQWRSSSTPTSGKRKSGWRSRRRRRVSRVVYKEGREGRHIFEVESLQGRSIRPDLARAVVQAGWALNEMRPVGLSLEKIFLQLTASESKSAAPVAAPHAEPGGSN